MKEIKVARSAADIASICQDIVTMYAECGEINIAFCDTSKEIEINEIKRSKRTLTQNKALHLYLRILSEALNDAGFDMKKVLKESVDIHWTPENAKEYLWRPVQEAVINKKSTTEANTTEYNEIHKALSRHLSQKLGIDYIPWPSYL